MDSDSLILHKNCWFPLWGELARGGTEVFISFYMSNYLSGYEFRLPAFERWIIQYVMDV